MTPEINVDVDTALHSKARALCDESDSRVVVKKTLRGLICQWSREKPNILDLSGQVEFEEGCDPKSFGKAMKLSQLENVKAILQTRDRVVRELELLKSLRRGSCVAETRFLGDGEDKRERFFSEDGKHTLRAVDEKMYVDFSDSIASALGDYLRRELRKCNDQLASIGVEVDDENGGATHERR